MGDYYKGDCRFPRPLQPGDPVILDVMVHYTTEKTTMFTGIAHPAIALRHTDGSIEVYRAFSYEDYRDRMC